MDLVVWGSGQSLALEGVHMLGRWPEFGGYGGKEDGQGCRLWGGRGYWEEPGGLCEAEVRE